MYKYLFLIWFITGFAFIAKAQKPDTVTIKSRSDSLSLKRDSAKSKRFVPKITKEKTYHPDSLHDPHKALIRSLMVPGWGQLYNHKWWKVPLIYGGLGLLGDVIIFNNNYYNIFLKEAQLRERGVTTNLNPLLAQVSTADVDTYTDLYRRNRDLGILGFIGGWGIQMIDAYIDAKFQHSYTMDNDLSFKIRPSIMSQPVYALSSTTYIPSVTITFTLR
jgi:uncharacterized protein DUF5683